MAKQLFRDKELSWLAFNERLLQEADRTDVPLIERLKFLGIYSNNLDEFFRVKVAILKRWNVNSPLPNPANLLKEIQEIVMVQSERFSQIYDRIIRDLESEKIFILNETQLNEEQGRFVKAFYEKSLRSKLMPIILSKKRELPDLRDAMIYLAVELRTKGEKEKEIKALIELPTETFSRFVELPSAEGAHCIMLLDDLIRYVLRDIFFMFTFDNIEAYTIKLTRDAEIDLDDDITRSFMKKVALGLEKRKEADPVRFVYDKRLSDEFLKLFLHKLEFRKDDVIIKGGRYHNFKDFIGFPNMGKPHLVYPPLPPVVHPDFKNRTSIFPVLRKKDILLHIPYHSFIHFIDFLREASIDPYVKTISFTIYRVASDSSVVNALINAARNGKQVNVIMELQARFDESANIQWADRLRAEGVKVIFGVPGLKVHSKLCLVQRKENKMLVTYAVIGTGNFNEDSAKVFSDNMLFTTHLGITKEVEEIFNFFSKNYQQPKFNHLWVAPFTLRKNLQKLLAVEIKNAKAGRPAYIYLKINNLVDDVLIQKLYQAHEAGVEIRLNVRGMFCLFPKFSPKLDAIQSIGLIDRYLEHSRIYIACNNNNPQVYISSADWMARNLDNRVEVACPIYNEELKHELVSFFDIQWRDNVATRILDNELSNCMRERVESEEKIRSQTQFYEFLKSRAL